MVASPQLLARLATKQALNDQAASYSVVATLAALIPTNREKGLSKQNRKRIIL
jgi:hypothetical protein